MNPSSYWRLLDGGREAAACLVEHRMTLLGRRWTHSGPTVLDALRLHDDLCTGYRWDALGRAHAAIRSRSDPAFAHAFDWALFHVS